MSIYTVQRGDNLSTIARRHNLNSWRDIYDHPENAQFRQQRPNPNLIRPGDRLFIPDAAGEGVGAPSPAGQRIAMRTAVARARRVATRVTEEPQRDAIDFTLSDDQFGVRLILRSSRTLAEVRRFVWPDGFSPPEQVLQPAPTAGDDMMNSYNQRHQNPSSLVDRSPRYSQFLLNLTSFGHGGNAAPIWSHMRQDLRRRILARQSPPPQWPQWVPANLGQVLERWLDAERATTEVVRFERSSYAGIAPHPAIVAYIHSGTAVDFQMYAEAPVNPSYYESRGAGSGEAHLLAEVAEQVNGDMFILVDKGLSPERARQRLAQVYRDRLIVTILETIKLVAGGAVRFGGPPGALRSAPPAWHARPRNGRAVDEAIELARAEAAELNAGESVTQTAARTVTQRIRPVNGTVNVGGGLEAGSSSATNLNPIVPGTGGPGVNANIPNHVRAGFEEIGEIFEVGSVTMLKSSRLPYHTVNWVRSARGAHAVMASGGRVALNIWTRTAEESQVVLRAFVEAGFHNVELIGQGAGTMLMAVR